MGSGRRTGFPVGVLKSLNAPMGLLSIYLGNQIWGDAIVFDNDGIGETAFGDTAGRSLESMDTS
jgi:hypothetical protein